MVRYSEDKLDADVLARFDLPVDHSVLALVSPPGGLTKEQPYLVVVSCPEPQIKAVVESGEHTDASPTSEEAEVERFSNSNVQKVVSTSLTFTCLELPQMQKRAWTTVIPFAVDLTNHLWDDSDQNLSETERRRLHRAMMQPFHFEATGFMVPTVSLHKGDAHGALFLAVSIDEAREPYLFALEMGEGRLRWKQHVDTEETLQEEEPGKEQNSDSGAGGYKATFDHSFKFEAVVRESEQSAHMQEIHWRQFKRDMLRFQSSYDGSFGSVLPHCFYTIEGMFAPSRTLLGPNLHGCLLLR